MTKLWREILVDQFDIAAKFEGGGQAILECLPDAEDREFLEELKEIMLSQSHK